MKFDLNEFASLEKEEKKKYLVTFGKGYHIEEGHLTQNDLDKFGIYYDKIRYLFGSLRDYLIACDIPTTIRKKNMTTDEFKQHLLEIKSVTKLNFDCPAFFRKKSTCFQNCTCWSPTPRYIRENGRTNIRFQGKTMLLHRASYLVFNGDIENKNIIMHLCDNEICFNPKHLLSGTSKENNRQTIAKNRKHHADKKVKDHNLSDAYDFISLLSLIKSRSEITPKNEWLYTGSVTNTGYPRIMISGIIYTIAKLVLANKLGKKYEEIDITRHILPDGSEGQKHDLNPDHLFEGNRSDNAYDTVLNNVFCPSTETITYIRNKASDIKQRGDASNFDREMSKELNLPISTIQRIRLGTGYKPLHNGDSIQGNCNTPVIQMDLEGNIIKEYASIKDALESNNFKSKNMITDVCEGKSQTYMGFKWKYKN